MGAFYETIPESLISWIRQQKVFWVATAPLSSSGHVNVSPKGGQYFGVIDEKTFWYHDLTGSGNETISHLLEPNNGRITILLNAFEGAPKIVRLWGKGKCRDYFSVYMSRFDDSEQARYSRTVRSDLLNSLTNTPSRSYPGRGQSSSSTFIKSEARADFPYRSLTSKNTDQR